MAKRKGGPSLNQLLAELKDFVIYIANTAPPPGNRANPFFPKQMFSTEKYGGLMLSGDDADRYSRISTGFVNAMGEAMSSRAVSELVQTAILKTLDLRKRSQSQSVVQHADAAVSEVKRALSSPHLKWVSCIPILGITPPKKAWGLNNVVLISIKRKEGKAYLKTVDRITDLTKHTDDEKDQIKALRRQNVIGEHPGQAFALVTTLALDAVAAWESAKRRLRFTLDCLNFAVDVVHGNHKFYELSMDEPPRRHYGSGITLNVTDHMSTREHNEVNSAVGTLNAEEFRKAIRRDPALRTLWRYLESATPNGHQNRVLAAMQWAGRASAERRDEEAVLLRAIALESLILGDGDKGELTLRLTLSIIHLLGGILKSRLESSRLIKNLYALRSKIVHSGRYEVDEADSRLLRQFTILSFYRVLAHKRFATMAGSHDLDDWFEARMRGGAG